MMRRALVGIVPDELLNRKRKRFVPREETRSLSTEWADLFEGHQHILGCSIGILDAIGFRKALEKESCDKEVWSGKLERALVLESWLRHLRKERVLFNLTSEPGEQCALSSDAKNLQSPSPYEFS
jgi:asparagine synthase (glutamine-hydrolysing)